MRSDDFREDGDLCGEEDEDEDEEEEQEEEEEEEEEAEVVDGVEEGEGKEEDGGVSWHSGATVGSRLGLLQPIMEEDSGGEEDPKRVNSSLAERLSFGYFDIPSMNSSPLERSVSESGISSKRATDLDADHFGRPRTADRPKTPLPEKREQKKLEPSPFLRPPSSSSACIDCIASGSSHHHHGAPAPRPVPSQSLRTVGSSRELSAKETGTANSTTPANAKAKANTLTTPPKSSIPVPSETRSTPPPRPRSESPAPPTLRRTANLPVREYTPSREPVTPKVAAPAPPREATLEHPYERRSFNPETPARQRAPSIPPTPPTTPARRKSLPPDFSTIRRSNFNVPSSVEEDPSSSSAIADDVDGEHGVSHGEDGHKCPFRSHSRSSKEMRHSRSHSFQSRPGTPELVRGLSHSYSAPDIPRLSNRSVSNPEPPRPGSYSTYSRPTTPELSRLSHTYTYSRPSTSDGSRLAYPYSRPTTPEVVFAGTGTRVPFVDIPEPISRMPSPPPPTIASTGTSPASSMLLPLAPPIDFRRGSLARTAGRSISSEDLSVAEGFFKSVLQARLAREKENQYVEPESPMEEKMPQIKLAPPEIPKIEIVEPEPKPAEVVAVEVPVPIVHQDFVTVFVIPRVTKYYLQGQTFWNIVISLWLAFFILGFLVTVSTGFVYFFGDGTTNNGLRGALFGEGKLLEDLSPLIATVLYFGVFACVTVFSRRAIKPDSADGEKSILTEVLGSSTAASVKRRFSPRRLKRVLLFFLITAGVRGLYLGAQIVGPVVGPPVTAVVNKGVAAGVDYWHTIRAPVEISVEIVQKAEPWDEIDFMYFQPDEKAIVESEEKASSTEGNYGTYYPSAEKKGYHGEDDGMGWGAVLRLGLALMAGPAGVMAWRRGRNM